MKILLNALEFFAVLSVMFLFFSFLSNVLMRKVSFSNLFSLMDNRMLGLGNIVSALMGAVTPFCVCTTIPIFSGMIQMGVKTNIAVSFLLSSPLLSISAAVLIAFLFGWKFCGYYITAVLIFSTLGGFLVRWLGLDNEIADKLTRKSTIEGKDDTNVCNSAAKSSFVLFKDILVPLTIGALIAGLIHNYVPVKIIEMLNKYPLWVTIPLAALIGFPIYSNITVLAPVCFALANKGMNQAAVITFLMSGAGISFPSAVVLKSLLKTKLFVYYLVYTFIAYCLIGFAFNILK